MYLPVCSGGAQDGQVALQLLLGLRGCLHLRLRKGRRLQAGGLQLLLQVRLTLRQLPADALAVCLRRIPGKSKTAIGKPQSRQLWTQCPRSEACVLCPTALEHAARSSQSDDSSATCLPS